MFLDANIFIKAVLSPKAPDGRLCNQFLERIIRGEAHACTSALVLNEVLYFFETNFGKERALRVFGNILAYQNLEILAVDQKILRHVAAFSMQGLDATDAYHAATMKANGIDIICSFDKGFDKISGIKRQMPK